MSSSSSSSTGIQYGPLHGSSPYHLAPRVYDHFCLLFLNRPGTYYIRMTPAIATRSLSSFDLIQHLKAFVSTSPAPTVIDGDRTRDYMHLPALYPFFKGFIPDKLSTQALYYRHLSLYLTLLLSPRLSLVQIPYISTPHVYGVVAQTGIAQNTSLDPDLRGTLSRVTEKQMERLKATGADYSTLTFERDEFHLAAPPSPLHSKDKKQKELVVKGHKTRKLQQRNRRREEALKEKTDDDDEDDDEKKRKGKKKNKPGPKPRQDPQRLYIITGPICFLNHACVRHRNVIPAGWDNREGDYTHQWQVGKSSDRIEAEQELTIYYGSEMSGDTVCYACRQEE
jgi:hypothetical protein